MLILTISLFRHSLLYNTRLKSADTIIMPRLLVAGGALSDDAVSDVSLSDVCLTQWRIQNLCKGGGVASGRMARGVGLGRGCAPSQKKKKFSSCNAHFSVF